MNKISEKKTDHVELNHEFVSDSTPQNSQSNTAESKDSKGDDEKWLSDQVDLSLATQSGNKLITTGVVINIFKALLSC